MLPFTDIFSIVIDSNFYLVFNLIKIWQGE